MLNRHVCILNSITSLTLIFCQGMPHFRIQMLNYKRIVLDFLSQPEHGRPSCAASLKLYSGVPKLDVKKKKKKKKKQHLLFPQN